MQFLYVFILQFLYNSTCFERPFHSSSGVHDLLYLQLVLSCRYSKSWTPDDERNGHSKHVELYKNCRINTYRNCILLICLHNWLWCTVHIISYSFCTYHNVNLIFEAALYSNLYGRYVYEKAQHLRDMFFSVCIYTETWNRNVVISVTYLPPPMAEDC